MEEFFLKLCERVKIESLIISSFPKIGYEKDRSTLRKTSETSKVNIFQEDEQMRKCAW